MIPKYFLQTVDNRKFTHWAIAYYHKNNYCNNPFRKTSNILLDLPRFCIN